MYICINVCPVYSQPIIVDARDRSFAPVQTPMTALAKPPRIYLYTLHT